MIDDILITEQLSYRLSHLSNWQGEAQAMQTLARQMANGSETLLQTIVEKALELAQAGTAGISLLETTPEGAEVFRWSVVAGTLAQSVGFTTPRNFSPCAICIECGTPQLYEYPERYFTYLQETNTSFVEALVLPLMSDHHALGTLWIISHDEQRHFDSEDERVMTSLANITAAILLKQRQTEELMAKNAQLEIEVAECKLEQAQSQALIKNLPGGAVFVVDRDLRYLVAEGEALSVARFKPEDFIGRTIFEVLPPDLAEFYEALYRQALAGKSFEHEHEAHEHSYISRGTPLRSLDGEVYAVLAISYDITERKQAEVALRRAAALDAFRVKLSDTLRSLTDSAEIQYQAARLLGEHLGVDRAYYVEVNEVESYARVNQNYLRGDSPSLVGTFPLAKYGWSVPYLRRGEILIVANTQTDNIVPDGDRELMAAIRIISHITLPLIKAGELVGALCVTESVPRKWLAIEIELVRETAERIWATIERARAEAALRESEIQLIREQSAREEERQRIETLAELDRAKTVFFSNVSHEFRTPLTLLLAPLQDALSDQALAPPQRERLELAQRNAMRLQKLVNTLLDFSRIEAGRIEAIYEPTDLALLTKELASVFRSAIEQAGLRLIVACPPLPPVYVDREMWEKIVLNLLSNAFKFTFEGEIAVRLNLADDDRVILQIQDTGIGISPEALPHLFERFYQVREAKGRTHEGTGIGLALVSELIQLHGGTIDVSSTLRQGTCFTITLSLGTKHLPSDRLQHNVGDHNTGTRTLASTALSAATYVEEVERWLPQNDFRHEESSKNQPKSKILLVDDNSDMRDYLRRILSEHVEVEAVADGVAALSAAQARVPDLVLTDVMMPKLDGFGLLKALRTDPRTREIPIILLSACAGEEAIIEGLEAGADDYLIKPFSAQELVSRVKAHLQMAHLRGEALEQARTTIRRRDELLSTVSHELNTPLVAILGWTRLLRSNLPSLLTLGKALDTIERNAMLQAKLVQDLLDLSRISANKLRLNLEPVELESVIETALATVVQTAEAKKINLVWQNIEPQDANSIIVMGDRERLQQIICNLLTNAIKFTPEAGDVTVELSMINDTSDVSYAQICVMDTGIGITADFLPHLFDFFSQAQNSNAAKGLGLGLAIAQHLVELHNGTIYAQSAGVGQGATFTVRLPLLKPDE